MDQQDNTAIKRFLEVLGGILITTGLSPIGRALVEGRDYRIIPAILIAIIGAIILCFGLFWHWLKPASDNKITLALADVATSPRWWFGVIFLAWLYMAITSTLAEIRLND
jgi:hypothetical protein